MFEMILVEMWSCFYINACTVMSWGGGAQELRNDVLTTYKVIYSSQKVFREGRKFFGGKKSKQAQCECNVGQ